MGLLHRSHVGFQAAAAFAIPPMRPTSAPIFRVHPAAASTPTATALTATSTTATTRRYRRHRDRRPYSLLFASKDSRESSDLEDDESPQPPPPLGSAQDANAETETDADLNTNPREGRITPPPSDLTDAPDPLARGEQTPATTPAAAADPTPDREQAAPPQIPDGDGPAGGGGEPEVDWDTAWAKTRQKMEKDRKAAPAFSGRKQVVATKNSNGDYDFVEISADGSRRQRGKGDSGGFGFADGNQAGTDGRGRIQDKELEAVNLATTNKVGVRVPCWRRSR